MFFSQANVLVGRHHDTLQQDLLKDSSPGLVEAMPAVWWCVIAAFLMMHEGASSAQEEDHMKLQTFYFSFVTSVSFSLRLITGTASDCAPVSWNDCSKGSGCSRRQWYQVGEWQGGR